MGDGKFLQTLSTYQFLVSVFVLWDVLSHNLIFLPFLQLIYNLISFLLFHLMQTLFLFFSSHFLLLSCVEKMLLTDFPISCLIHFFNIFILTYDRFIVKACKVFTWSSSHFLVHLDAYLTHFAENFESISFVYGSSIVIEGISTL